MCLNPITAYKRRPTSGFSTMDIAESKLPNFDAFGSAMKFVGLRKRNITFNPKYGYVDTAFKIPCGKCAECRAKKKADWSNRIVMESKMHEKNAFVTLTYAPDFLPKNEVGLPTLVKRHLQLFLKRLRKELAKKGIFIRYYAVGEYGTKKHRPHYHLVIFGYDFPDKKPWKRNGRFLDYVSELLGKTWTCGYHTVNKWNDSFCNYIAGYVTKKLDSDKQDYSFRNIEPEFHLMSRRRGIGYGFFLKNYKHIFGNLKLQIMKSGKAVICSIPRQFWNWVKELSTRIFFAAKSKFMRLGAIYAGKRDELSTLERIHIEQVKTYLMNRGRRKYDGSFSAEEQSYFEENWQWSLSPMY